MHNAEQVVSLVAGPVVGTQVGVILGIGEGGHVNVDSVLDILGARFDGYRGVDGRGGGGSNGLAAPVAQYEAIVARRVGEGLLDPGGPRLAR